MGVLHHDSHRSSGFTKFVYFVFVLNVLAVVVLIIGLLAGWFHIDAGRMADGTYHMGLAFDSEEADKDIGETVNAASNMTETASSASELETIDGEVQSVDGERLVFSNGDTTHEVALTEATEFSDGFTTIGDIRPGAKLRVTMQQKEGRNFAVKITEASGPLTE